MYTKYNFFLIQEKVLNSFPRLHLEIFARQSFSIKYIYFQNAVISCASSRSPCCFFFSFFENISWYRLNHASLTYQYIMKYTVLAYYIYTKKNHKLAKWLFFYSRIYFFKENHWKCHHTIVYTICLNHISVSSITSYFIENHLKKCTQCVNLFHYNHIQCIIKRCINHIHIQII